MANEFFNLVEPTPFIQTLHFGSSWHNGLVAATDVRAQILMKQELVRQQLQEAMMYADQSENAPSNFLTGTTVGTFTGVQNKPAEEPKPDLVAELIKVEDLPEDYGKVARSIGLKSPAIFAYRFRKLLQREEICVYPNAKVSAFLEWAVRQERKQGNHVDWVWKPLRSRDHVAVDAWARGNGRVSSQTYVKQVPLGAMKVVQKIETALPMRSLFTKKKNDPMGVAFFVSDYEAPEPDPFLMAMGPDGSRWVLYHWDEPNFVM